MVTTADWTNFTRYGHPLSLQMRPSNTLEVWPRALKHRLKFTMRQWSLKGLIDRVTNVATDYALRAEKARDECRAVHVSETVMSPSIPLLSSPAQKLRIVALIKAHALPAQGVEVRALADELCCDCLQWRRYTLPYKYVR